MANFTLTVGADTVVGGAADDTVNGTAATLYAGDNLTGGAGTDVLALYGSGTFRVDQLAAFSGFESITLNNFTNGSANLYLGSQPIAVTGFGAGGEQLYLGSGAVTFHAGSGYNSVWSTSASNWNAGNVIEGSLQNGFPSLTLYLNWNGPANAIYDLTSNTLANIGYLYGFQENLTLKINSAVAVEVANFSGNGINDKLVTSDTALDLSHSKVAGFTVASTNAAGTIFSVQDVGTAFQIVGGTGQDTITAQGFVFTPDQRNAIFATASVEKIVDLSGTYTAPPPNPNVFTLTVGADTVVGGAADDTVNGTAATLYAGDNLTGGAGTDVLALYGSGTFRVDQLAAFSGFESITLNNFTNGSANLYLGSQPIAVTGFGAGGEQLYLGSGAVTFHAGSGYNSVWSTSASNWNAGNVIEGSLQNGFPSLTLYLNWNGPANAIYDLTSNTLANIGYLYGFQENLTLKINSAVAVEVANFSGNGINDKLVTSDTALDLSHSKVAGFTVASTNAAGTIFSVQDVGTAFQIVGGTGQDTITAQGFVFTPDQRNAIFATNSIESIQDQSGTYFHTNTPVVTTSDQNVHHNEWHRVKDWFSATDADGDTITQFQFWDSGAAASSGYFWTPNNPHHAANAAITVNAADLDNVWFRGGQTAGTEILWARASDGATWSAWKSFNLSTLPNSLPVATINDHSLHTNEWHKVQDWLSATDADADAITQYQFWDSGTAATSGYFWTPDNAHHSANAEITVAASELNNVWVRGAQAGGSETMWVRAFDGSDWSAWDSFNFTTLPNTPPVATIDDHSLHTNEWSRVASWVSYSDADGNPTTQYQFWDGGSASNSGYFWTPDNPHHAANTAITVAASDLNNVWVQGGQAGGSETMYVRAFDGTDWSAWDSFDFTTLPNTPPVVAVSDQTLHLNEWLKVQDWFSTTDADGNPITQYQFWDSGTSASSGYFWTPDNPHHAADTGIVVNAADLDNVWFRGGQVEGPEMLWVQVFDGTDWSQWQSFSLTTELV